MGSVLSLPRAQALLHSCAAAFRGFSILRFRALTLERVGADVGLDGERLASRLELGPLPLRGHLSGYKEQVFCQFLSLQREASQNGPWVARADILPISRPNPHGRTAISTVRHIFSPG